MLKGALLRKSFSSRWSSSHHAGVQQSQPQIYDSLTKNLTAEEQSILQGVINQADALAQHAAAAAALEQHDRVVSEANGQPSAVPAHEVPSTNI
jgi:DNA uptake protein ComE-like DNA-binding protein